jgi:hypothetical protein
VWRRRPQGDRYSMSNPTGIMESQPTSTSKYVCVWSDGQLAQRPHWPPGQITGGPLGCRGYGCPHANFATGRPPEGDGKVDGEAGSALAVTPTSSREVDWFWLWFCLCSFACHGLAPPANARMVFYLFHDKKWDFYYSKN